jgi:hypothetical protein
MMQRGEGEGDKRSMHQVTKDVRRNSKIEVKVHC